MSVEVEGLSAAIVRAIRRKAGFLTDVYLRVGNPHVPAHIGSTLGGVCRWEGSLLFGQSWTVVGLIVEMVGVLLIFVWPPPPPDLTTVDHLVVELDEASETKARAKLRRHRMISGFALVLIFVGLGLQLYDAWK